MAVSIIAFFVILTTILSFKIIPTGYVGVKTTFGQISQSVMHPGFNWKVPYVQSISKVCTKQQDTVLEDQVWGETSERTAVYFQKTTVTYSINGDKANWIYANVSDYKHNLVSNTLITSAIKGASKTQTPTDVTNRAIIEPIIRDLLQKSIDEKYGSDIVTIHKVVVYDIDFQEAYQAAIAAKQNAQMAYEKQQIENKKAVETAEAENKKAIAKAEADATVKIKKAEADAEAVRIAAEAEAEANKKINDSLSDKVLKNKYYETWNGELPQVVGSDSTVLIPSEATATSTN